MGRRSTFTRVGGCGFREIAMHLRFASDIEESLRKCIYPRTMNVLSAIYCLYELYLSAYKHCRRSYSRQHIHASYAIAASSPGQTWGPAK